MESAVALSDDEFKSKYGFDKPSKDCKMVTHCTKGGRATRAQGILQGLGFNNAHVYKGSLNDWRENGGEVLNDSEDK